MFLRKNGITGTLYSKCPYDNAELKRIYDYTYYSGAITEMPEDYLPQSFKRANVESIEIFECPKCQKHFIKWNNWVAKTMEGEPQQTESKELHEVKLLPDNNYSREGEAGLTEPVIPEAEDMHGVTNKSDKECDCGGDCDNQKCENNKANPKPGRFDRPLWYG